MNASLTTLLENAGAAGLILLFLIYEARGFRKWKTEHKDIHSELNNKVDEAVKNTTRNYKTSKQVAKSLGRLHNRVEGIDRKVYNVEVSMNGALTHPAEPIEEKEKN